jgi:signal transduction histidine kinase/PAS domain-containing protein
MDSLSAPLNPGASTLDRLTLLCALGEHIQRARHVDVIFRRAVEGLSRVLEADGSALLIRDEGLLRVVAACGAGEKLTGAVDGFAPWDSGARDPEPVVVADVHGDARVASVRRALLAGGVEAVACLPLLHRSRLIGEILLFRGPGRPFVAADIEYSTAVAGQLALAISRSRSDAEQVELLRRFEVERTVLESVVKQMPAGVLLADVPSGRVIMSNAQVEVMWGRPLHVHSAQISDYASWRGRDRDGRRLAAEDWPLARSVLYGETVRGEEIEVERADGTRISVRMSSAPVLDSQGRRLAAVATVDDVTLERAAAAQGAFMEEATAALTASLELDATVTALTGLVLGRFADWCVIHQLGDGGMLHRVRATHVDASKAALVADFARGGVTLDSDHPVAQVVRERRPRVAMAPAHVVGMLVHEGDRIPEAVLPRCVLTLPLRGRGGTPGGALSLMRTADTYTQQEVELLAELAERAGLALDNARLYEQARSADSEKSRFLAVMSHEFRTPLSAILGYADILTAEVHGDLSARQRSHVERMKASVRHLSHLVDEILSYASMEAGRERIRPEPVDSAALVVEVSELMQPIAEAAGLELRVRGAEHPAGMVTDPSKLRQILINLVSNAIKYTPEGHVELALEAGPERACFRVTDTGPGIPEAHMEAIFQPFWQIECGPDRRPTGTGLGLAVARQLARLMGGDIVVSSGPTGGSEFVVELPREPVGGLATARVR